MKKPQKRSRKRKTSKEATDAALLLVEHRDARGGLGKRSLQASEAASALGHRRMALMTKKQICAMSAKGGKAYWASMSPEERTLEQRRRARKRISNRRKAVREKLGK